MPPDPLEARAFRARILEQPFINIPVKTNTLQKTSATRLTLMTVLTSCDHAVVIYLRGLQKIIRTFFSNYTSTVLAQVLNCKGKLLNNSVFDYCHRLRRRGGDQISLCIALCLGYFCPYSQSVEVKLTE